LGLDGEKVFSPAKNDRLTEFFRAGLCADPKDYRYCGYAEALAKGSSLARQGIRVVLGHSDAICWKEVSEQYRKYHRRSPILRRLASERPTLFGEDLRTDRRQTHAGRYRPQPRPDDLGLIGVG
jgi:hypothetical protein